jgi:hypothetical protein
MAYDCASHEFLDERLHNLRAQSIVMRVPEQKKLEKVPSGDDDRQLQNSAQ